LAASAWAVFSFRRALSSARSMTPSDSPGDPAALVHPQADQGAGRLGANRHGGRRHQRPGEGHLARQGHGLRLHHLLRGEHQGGLLGFVVLGLSRLPGHHHPHQDGQHHQRCHPPIHLRCRMSVPTSVDCSRGAVAV
jgi:hypothetical protein